MPTVAFTQNIQRHVPCPTMDVPGATVREALERVFETNPLARGYVLDEPGAVRPHMVIFVDGRQIHDRTSLSDPVRPDGEVHVMQAHPRSRSQVPGEAPQSGARALVVQRAGAWPISPPVGPGNGLPGADQDHFSGYACARERAGTIS